MKKNWRDDWEIRQGRYRGDNEQKELTPEYSNIKYLSKTSIHKSGVIAYLTQDAIRIENTKQIDESIWDRKELIDQAVQLWKEGRL